MNDTLMITIIGLVCLLAGVMAGLFLAGSRSAEPAKNIKSNKNLIEVLRVWRHKSSGKLAIEIEGKLYEASKELSVNRHTRLVELVDELGFWSGGREIDQRMAQVGNEAAAVNQPSQTEPQTTPPQGSPSSALQSTTEIAPPKKQKISVNSGEKPSRPAASEPTNTAPIKSIAAQIDDILQEKLESSPLKDRAIRIMELEGKGVVVMIGLDQYEGVSEVPDPEVRALLRECVMEWERTAGAE
jgi:hypothetical protein